MATESEIRAFIAEKLSAFDPAIDTSTGSSVYAAVVDPIVKRFYTDPTSRDIESLIIALMRQNYPGIDVSSPGGGLRDLLVKPLILMLEPFKREIASLRNQQTFADAATLTAEEARALATNLALDERLGDYAFGNVQVFYSTTRPVGVDPSIVFSTDDGIAFVPQETRVYGQLDFKRSASTYFINVPVRSQKQSAVSVPRGAIRNVSGLDGVLRVYNNIAISGGTAADTAKSIQNRAITALSERSLNTKRGIESAVFSRFDGVVSVHVSGYGDVDMDRDLLVINTSASAESTVGKLTAVGSDWYTLPITTESYNGSCTIPFSNAIRVVAPSAATSEKIKAAAFLRLAAPDALAFNTELLGRPRRVLRVDEDGDDLVVVVDDFETFPAQDSSYRLPSSNIVHNSEKYSGLNRYAFQGERFRLVSDYNGVDVVTGAVVPINDWLDVSVMTALPGASIAGRDFVVMCDPGTAYDGRVYHPVELVAPPASILCWPVAEYVRNRRVRVGRADSFTISADRVSSTYDGDVTTANAMLSNGLQILCKGTPAYSIYASRYDGVTVDPYSDGPGVDVTFVDTDNLDALTVAEVGTVVKYCKVTLHPSVAGWSSRGVSLGDMVALSLFRDDGVESGDNVFDGTALKLDLLSWSASGRAVLMPEDNVLILAGLYPAGLFVLPDNLIAGFDNTTGLFPADSYRVAWTAYRGHEDASNSVTTSRGFADFAFPPSGISTTYYMPAPRAAGYASTAGFVSINSFAKAADYGNLSNNSIWIRLGKSMFDVEPGTAVTTAAALLTNNIVDLDSAPGYYGDYEVVGPEYAAARYTGEAEVSITGGAARTVLAQRVSLPIVDGGNAVTDIDGVITVDATTSAYNFKGLSGFLMPFPAGPGFAAYWKARWGDGITQSEAAVEAALAPDGHPTLLFFAAADTSAEEIVSSTHIGGATDVFVQAAVVKDKLPRLRLTHDDLSLADCAGSDGRLDFSTPNLFYSDSLMAYLEGIVEDSAYPESLCDYVLQLEYAGGVAVTPVALRLAYIDPDNSAIKLDGEFDGGSGIIRNVRYRLCRTVATSMTAPAVVYRQGEDLITTAGSFGVRIPSGTELYVDPAVAVIALEILDGDNEGTYDIEEATANALTLAVPMAKSGTLQGYRIIAKQTGKMITPVGRVTSVALAGGVDSGVRVPYKRILNAAIIGYSSTSNNVITHDTTELGELTCAVGELAEFTVVGAVWSSLGAAALDVLRVQNADDAYAYFYVTAVSGDTLILDRNISVARQSSVRFELGRPTVATVRLAFKDKTYAEFTDATELSVEVDGVARLFRPSVDEQAVIVARNTTRYSATVSLFGDPDVGRLSFQSSHLDPVAAGVKIGDVVSVLSSVLEGTTVLTDNTTYALNGRILNLLVESSVRSVVFAGAEPMSATAVADNINRQLGSLMFATAVVGEKLRIYSAKPITVLDTGSSGVLGVIGLDLDNKTNYTPETVYRNYVISGLHSVDGGVELEVLAKTSAGGTEAATALAELGAGCRVFVEIIRQGVQRVYPADMRTSLEGFYYADIAMTSKAPYTLATDIRVKNGTMSGYTSLGYEVLTNNTSLSFSPLEEIRLSVTGTMLYDTATDASIPLALVGAFVDVAYERSNTVAALDAYLKQPSARVVCNSPLGRMFRPAVPVISINFTGSTAPRIITDAIAAYIRSKYPNMPATVFDIVGLVSRLSAQTMEMPVSIGALDIGFDRVERLIMAENVLALGNTAHYADDASFISVNR